MYTVYDAVMERMEYIFNEFENVLIAFSGGKDSGVCLNLFYDYAKKNNLLHKLAVYHEDYEGGFPQTFEYVERMFDSMPDIKRYWLCLPIKAACSASMFQMHWIPWDKDLENLWIRKMPTKDYIINESNVWFPFKKGTSGFDLRIIFAKEFAKKYGKTAVIVGLRMEESLSRRAIMTSKRRTSQYKKQNFSKIVDENTVNFYPIIDWLTDDIWVANTRFNWDYNKLYDLYYMAGLNFREMRTASPFHASGQKNLALYKVICPNTWAAMVSRVNGVNFTGIYGGTTAMGWRSITKPKHFTWKQYAMFLIETLPKEAKDRLLYHLERLNQSWAEDGYGRNPNVIAIMEKEGVELERTGVDDPRCIKPGFYEIVKIKNGFPDETSAKDFRHCPNWKDVCIAVMKNDYTLKTLGLGQTKNDLKRRKEIMDKYRNIL
ncbi:DUF3440 domain-containing protein [Capnocytophaga canis]|uniref:DUF3440 domain-containing protein n=1 Tax=Capnocytophaga canis TaxID=1848903 RepID=UPI001562A211|nr:DUF3440 domain-containing protein [Capnocytophaga canis]